jgi:ubiquinone biosynthesis protein
VNFRLPRTVRSIRRIETIARVLTRHGFGHLVNRLNLGRFVPLPKGWRESGPDFLTQGGDLSLGERLRAVFEELGPTFIKLGQMISTRPDLFPADIVSSMIKLQDHVPPFPTADARVIIADDLGCPVEEAFEEFDSEPFASGSVAQVYRARTRRTSAQAPASVVVKVKRPDIEEIVRLDMTILRWLADLVERWAPELVMHKPHVIVDEFERSVLHEMDLIAEAATIARFGDLFGPDPNFRIPQVYWELTGPRVLSMEEIRGVSAQVVLATCDPSIDRHGLAVRLVMAFMRQFFEMGLFHADPHPGNLLIEPPANVGLIDFGLVGRLDDELMGHLVVGLAAAFNREPDVIVEVFADMNAIGEETDRPQLARDFRELIDKYHGLPIKRFDLQALFFEVTTIVRQHHVVLPREFVLFGKALVAIGGICLQLDPQLDLVELTRPRLRRLLAERFTPTRIVRSVALSGWHLFSILKNAPSQLRDVSRRLAQGHWQVTIRHRNLDELAHEIDRASNRLGFAVIIGSVIVGSSWVLGSGSTLTLLHVPLQAFGVVGYILAGVMGLWLVIAILRSGKLS